VINYAAKMSRIAARAPDITAMREQAESEQQLLVFLLCDVTRRVTSDSVFVDQPSVQLLNDHCAWLSSVSSRRQQLSVPGSVTSVVRP